MYYTKIFQKKEDLTKNVMHKTGLCFRGFKRCTVSGDELDSVLLSSSLLYFYTHT